jgi:hypothetical protein
MLSLCLELHFHETGKQCVTVYIVLVITVLLHPLSLNLKAVLISWVLETK